MKELFAFLRLYLLLWLGFHQEKHSLIQNEKPLCSCEHSGVKMNSPGLKLELELHSELNDSRRA